MYTQNRLTWRHSLYTFWCNDIVSYCIPFRVLFYFFFLFKEDSIRTSITSIIDLISRELRLIRIQQTEEKMNDSGIAFVERKRMVGCAKFVRRTFDDDLSKTAGPMQVQGIFGSLVQTQKCVRVSRYSVTQAESFPQQAAFPNHLTALFRNLQVAFRFKYLQININCFNGCFFIFYNGIT